MPLARAKKKSKKAVNKTVASNIKELHDQPGPHMKALEAKYGRGSKKMQQIRVAAAENAARGGERKKKGRSPRKRR